MKEKRNIIKFTLLLSSSLTIMSGATIAPSLPQMASVFEGTPNAVFLSKLILTIPALFIALWAPFAGKIIDMIGRLKLFYVSLMLYAAGGISGYFLNNLHLILVGRAFLGIAVGGIMTTTITLIGDYFKDEERKRFVGYQNAFVGLGGVIFITLGGVMADINWRYPFLIYSFSLAVLLLAGFYLKEPPVRETSKSLTKSKSANIIPKVLWVIIGSAICGMIFFYIVPTQLPFLLETLNIKGNSLSGYAIACTTLSGTIASLMYKRVLSVSSYDKIMLLVFLLIGLGFLIVKFTSSYSVIVGAMLIIGAGNGLLIPNLNMWLLESVDESIRGMSSGLLTTGIFLGQFLSPILFDPLIDQMGIHNSFLWFGTGCFVLGLCFVFRLFIRRANPTLVKNA